MTASKYRNKLDAEAECNCHPLHLMWNSSVHHNSLICHTGKLINN